MISQLAKNVAYFFVQKKIISSDTEEIYAYGYEILISETINWIITIIIAFCTGSILETVFYMLAFMRLRESLGGFHAKTHYGCILISTIVYVLFLICIYITPNDWYWQIIIFGLSLHTELVFKIAPIAHPNKPFSDDREFQKFRKRSIARTFIYGLVVSVFIILPWEWSKLLAYSIMLGMLSASLSMVYEFMKQKQRKEVPNDEEF